MCLDDMFRKLSGHHLGKRLRFGLSYVVFAKCLFVILVISHFSLEGESLVLIAPVIIIIIISIFNVPGHRLHFTFCFYKSR